MVRNAISDEKIKEILSSSDKAPVVAERLGISDSSVSRIRRENGYEIKHVSSSERVKGNKSRGKRNDAMDAFLKAKLIPKSTPED